MIWKLLKKSDAKASSVTTNPSPSSQETLVSEPAKTSVGSVGVNIQPSSMPKEDRPLDPVIPIGMHQELDCLEYVHRNMDHGPYVSFLQGLVMHNLWYYRQTGEVKYLEQMQFYVHRMTHMTMKIANVQVETAKRQMEIEKLNLMNRIHNGEDG
jgi:hypothetical protein